MTAACVVLALSGCTAQSGTPAQATLALVNVNVIDGTGTPPRPNQTVLIDGSTIVAIGGVGQVAVPEEALQLDVAGRWLVPGFVDLHVHFPPQSAVHDAMLSRLLEFGVTTILNPGARPGAGVELRDRIAADAPPRPRMFTAGRLIDHSPDGHFIGGWAAQTPTESAIRAEVRQQVATGVDFTKLYAGLTPDLVAAAIDESHANGTPVIGHLESTLWRDAARMGIDMLVHSGWATPMNEIIELDDPTAASDYDWYEAYLNSPSNERFTVLVESLVEEEVVVVPTIGVQQTSALGNDLVLLSRLQPELAPEADLAGWWGDGWREQHPYFGFESEGEARALETIYVPALLAILAGFYEGGVTLAVGTDVGNPWMTPGVSFHHELELYQEAGIPPIQILHMATLAGASAVGMADRTGSIHVGKQADLVVLAENPGEDIRATRSIELVIVGGELVPR